MKLVHFPLLFKVLKGVDAITIYPFLFHKDKKASEILINHEKIHFMQIKKWGVFNFYFDYFRQYVKFRLKGLPHRESYLSISYEKEAYSNQENMDYLNFKGNR